MTKNEEIIEPKGIDGYPFIGNLLNLANPKRLDWLQSLSDTYGNVAKFKLLQREAYLVNHPDLVRDLLSKKSHIYTKNTAGFKVVKVVLGESTFTAMGETWQRKRRLAQPSFHKKQIANLATIMTDNITEMLDEWEVICDKKETINVADAMMRLTLKVVVKALFSTGLTDEEIQTVADVFPLLLKTTTSRMFYPFKFLTKLPTAGNAAYQGYIDKLDAIIFRIIKERRIIEEKPLDLLQMLMDARDEATNEPLTDQELRDEAMTIFIAGHETTANAMSWLWAILSDKTDIRAMVEQEVAEVLGSRTPTAMDFANLSYSLKVFKETMRLYPPVPILPRTLEQDDVLGNYHLKGKSSVFFSPYLLHRHPDFWDNPQQFDPHRFDPEAEKKQHIFAYLPFGGGPRICLGNSFAMMEAVFIVAMTVQRFRLNVLPNAKIEPEISLVTRPKYGVPVKLERREILL